EVSTATTINNASEPTLTQASKEESKEETKEKKRKPLPSAPSKGNREAERDKVSGAAARSVGAFGTQAQAAGHPSEKIKKKKVQLPTEGKRETSEENKGHSTSGPNSGAGS